MTTGRAKLIQGHTIISRALPPHPQDVYFIHPPTPQEPAYSVELREVIFIKDDTGGFTLTSGRRRKQCAIYPTLSELALTYNLDSEEWQVIR